MPAKKQLPKKKQLQKWITKKEQEESIRKWNEKQMRLDKGDDDIYDKDEREEELEEDEIKPGEAGFMEGYEDTKVVECSHCAKSFDLEKVVEREINGTTYQFCSKKCAEKFDERKAGLR